MGDLITAANITYLPWELALRPNTGLVACYAGYWWEVHPDKGLAFFKRGKTLAAQCNTQEAIVRHVMEVKVAALGHEARRLDRVFIPQRLVYDRANGQELETWIPQA
ncbi:MAG TPA: hypothetical protein VGH72_33870 [Pseudonocardia sp.]|jgi:hypothetical protein